MKRFTTSLSVVSFLLILVSMWSCQSSTSNETTADNTVSEDKITIVEDTSPDERSAIATLDEENYIKLNFDGKEYVFNYIPNDKADSPDINFAMKAGENTLLRMERGADDNMDKRLFIQIHNFPIQGDSLIGKPMLENIIMVSKTKKIKPRAEVIFNFMIKDREGKFVEHILDDKQSAFEIIYTKIEGDVYEGTFAGQVVSRLKKQAPPVPVSGSFKMKVVLQNELASKPAV